MRKIVPSDLRTESGLLSLGFPELQARISLVESHVSNFLRQIRHAPKGEIVLTDAENFSILGLMKSLLFGLSVTLLFAFPAYHSNAADPKPVSESQLKDNKRKAQKAWAKDEKIYKRDEFRQMETDYQKINNNYREPNIKEIINDFLSTYEKGNRVGCARMYLAQKTGGPDREKLLLQAIEENSDSYYLNGCSVGGLARLYLASLYVREGEKRKAEKWIAEIEADYPDAQNHSRISVLEMARALKAEE